LKKSPREIRNDEHDDTAVSGPPRCYRTHGLKIASPALRASKGACVGGIVRHGLTRQGTTRKLDKGLSRGESATAGSVVVADAGGRGPAGAVSVRRPTHFPRGARHHGGSSSRKLDEMPAAGGRPLSKERRRECEASQRAGSLQSQKFASPSFPRQRGEG
jgi:hypothetical protein